jgi:hypothetical protein
LSEHIRYQEQLLRRTTSGCCVIDQTVEHIRSEHEAPADDRRDGPDKIGLVTSTVQHFKLFIGLGTLTFLAEAAFSVLVHVSACIR